MAHEVLCKPMSTTRNTSLESDLAGVVARPGRGSVWWSTVFGRCGRREAKIRILSRMILGECQELASDPPFFFGADQALVEQLLQYLELAQPAFGNGFGSSAGAQ